MLTVSAVLIAAAFIAVIVHMINGKCPLWVAVLLLCVWAMLTIFPK